MPALPLRRVLAVLCVLLALPALGRADGVVIGADGKAIDKGLYKSIRFVPEKEQTAFIEWREGQERLFVSTRTEANAGPTLWIVPVPAEGGQVQAEPVERFPHVRSEQSLVKQACKLVDEVRDRALMSDLFVVGESVAMSFGTVAAGDFGVQVHQHVEKLGMVVEVLTASTPEALDQYLSRQKLGMKAGDLPTLAAYLQSGQALICAWSAEPGKEMQARALRIDFPTPAVFYPLRPTSAYTNEIKTVLYVRGLFQPRAGQAVPGMVCRYVLGKLDDEPLRGGAQYDGAPLTRIELSGSPSAWNQDLVLDPGAPSGITLARAVLALGQGASWLVPIGLGILLALFLPWLVVAPARRGRADYLWAAGAGAAISLSIYGSALVFAVWSLVRMTPAERSANRSAKPLLFAFLWALAQTVLLSTVDFKNANSALAPSSRTSPVLLQVDDIKLLWETPPLEQFHYVLVALGIVFLLSSPAFFFAGRKVAWLGCFALLHLAATLLLCLVLKTWINSAEPPANASAAGLTGSGPSDERGTVFHSAFSWPASVSDCSSTGTYRYFFSATSQTSRNP